MQISLPARPRHGGHARSPCRTVTAPRHRTSRAVPGCPRIRDGERCRRGSTNARGSGLGPHSARYAGRAPRIFVQQSWRAPAGSRDPLRGGRLRSGGPRRAREAHLSLPPPVVQPRRSSLLERKLTNLADRHPFLGTPRLPLEAEAPCRSVRPSAPTIPCRLPGLDSLTGSAWHGKSCRGRICTECTLHASAYPQVSSAPPYVASGPHHGAAARRVPQCASKSRPSLDSSRSDAGTRRYRPTAAEYRTPHSTSATRTRVCGTPLDPPCWPRGRANRAHARDRGAHRPQAPAWIGRSTPATNASLAAPGSAARYCLKSVTIESMARRPLAADHHCRADAGEHVPYNMRCMLPIAARTLSELACWPIPTCSRTHQQLGRPTRSPSAQRRSVMRTRTPPPVQMVRQPLHRPPTPMTRPTQASCTRYASRSE